VRRCNIAADSPAEAKWVVRNKTAPWLGWMVQSIKIT